MKTITSLALAFISFFSFAQNATVKATNFDISDNLDLRAVASIFGDSRNLEDFERKLNDPSLQISNLDLNNDNQVDYLRVIESVDNTVNLIVVQAVLGRDMYQDVATVELERNDRNNMVVQIVGNPYFYGNNYIYEPVFVSRPIIYDYFWVNNYHPYCSPWSWGYFPGHFIAWSPFPIFRYRSHINVYVGYNNVCQYSNFRRYNRAARLYESRRNYYYERINPDRSFTHRNANVNNRYELTQIRDTRTNTRTLGIENTRGNSVRTNNTIENAETTRGAGVRTATPISTESNTRGNSVRTNNTIENAETIRSAGVRTATPISTESNTRGNSVRTNNTIENAETTRGTGVRITEPLRSTTVRSYENSGSTRVESSTNNRTSQPRAISSDNSGSRSNSGVSRSNSSERNAGGRRS